MGVVVWVWPCMLHCTPLTNACNAFIIVMSDRTEMPDQMAFKKVQLYKKPRF
jgi:hypothetical protein